MAETITVDGVSVGGSIPPESVEWAESAYLGEVGEGHFTYEDTIGTKAFTGHKSISVTQSASSNSRIYTGFVATKTIRRGATTNRGAQRDITVGTKDLNDLLQRRIFAQSSTASNTATTALLAGKRPAETASARMTWLLASPYISTLVGDYGAVSYTSDDLDANDFRGQYPGDVLASMAKALGYNYYVRYNGAAKGELVFRDDNAMTSNTAAVSISNAGDEDNATIFAPVSDSLTQDPEHVYSGNYYTYSSGVGYATRDATATAFVARDGTSDDAGNKTADTALRDAEQFLDDSEDEEQMLTVTLRMAKEHVGKVQAGQRISTRLTHLATEGWDPARYALILRKRITQPLNTDNDYDVALDLSPQETPPVPDVCNDLYAPTASATFYPLGGSGSTPNPSDGVVYYFRPGIAEPYVPTVGYVGKWHFPAYSAGGAGNIDYAGDCVQNHLILMTVGNGTWTIQTERYAGLVRAIGVYRGPNFNSTTLVSSINSGDSAVITVSDATDGDCVRVVVVKDVSWPTCGSKWGWSEAVWAAS